MSYRRLKIQSSPLGNTSKTMWMLNLLSYPRNWLHLGMSDGASVHYQSACSKPIQPEYVLNVVLSRQPLWAIIIPMFLLCRSVLCQWESSCSSELVPPAAHNIPPASMFTSAWTNRSLDWSPNMSRPSWSERFERWFTSVPQGREGTLTPPC